MHGKLSLLLTALTIVPIIGCTRSQSDPETVAAAVASSVTTPIPMENPALHHLIRVSDTIYSGAEPHGEQSFAELEKLGIRTVVSVDGAIPDVENARAHGMRYIHAPFGYDGVPLERQREIRQVLESAERPIYFHCHHGKHRGPAAAAIALAIDNGGDIDAALAYLGVAGTSKDYAGLWRDVGAYDAEAVAAGGEMELHEITPISDFAGEMAKIDRTWDRLKLCKAAGWTTPADHPDVDPKHEAKMIEESLRELNRLQSEHDSEDMKERMTESEGFAAQLHEYLKGDNVTSADVAFGNLGKSCKSCHELYRN